MAKKLVCDTKTMFQRMLVDEVTITALICLLDNKGVPRIETTKFVKDFLSKIKSDFS